MGRSSKKPLQGASGPDLLETPVGQYLLNYVPKPRKLLTAAQVVAAFPPIKEKTPDQIMVGAIVEYINWEGPFHRHWRKKPYKKSPLLDPFWRALRALERTGEPVLASLEWRREFCDDTVFGIPESERSQVISEALSDHDIEIEQMKALLCLTQTLRASIFPSSYGKKRVRWHGAAKALVPLIRGAYRAAGRNKVDFQTPTAAGVIALQWALQQLGYEIEPDAIVQFIKRTPKLRDPKYGQFGPFPLSGD